MPDSSAFDVWLNVLHLVCRYLHIIGGMLLVGGILFYEMVVPIAISDLKDEAQIAVFARARWVFRWIVWTGAAILLLTGAVLTFAKLNVYVESEFLPQSLVMGRGQEYVSWPLRTGWWWAAHVLSAVFAIVVGLHLVTGNRPPKHPVGWLRLDLMMLLIVVFFATVTHQVEQIHQERAIRWMYLPLVRLIESAEQGEAATQPSTQPTTAPATDAATTAPVDAP